MGKDSKKTGKAGTEMPLGLSFGMAMNEDAMEHFAKMSKSEKKKVTDKAREVTSRAQMDAIIRDVADGKFN